MLTAAPGDPVEVPQKPTHAPTIDPLGHHVDRDGQKDLAAVVTFEHVPTPVLGRRQVTVHPTPGPLGTPNFTHGFSLGSLYRKHQLTTFPKSTKVYALWKREL